MAATGILRISFCVGMVSIMVLALCACEKPEAPDPLADEATSGITLMTDRFMFQGLSDKYREYLECPVRECSVDDNGVRNDVVPGRPECTIRLKNRLVSRSSEQYDQVIQLLSGFFFPEPGADGQKNKTLRMLFEDSDGWGSLHDEFDAIIISSEWIPELVRAGWLASFDTGIVNTKGKSLGTVLQESGVKPDKVDDKVYGIPLTRNADFIFYRKSCFDSDEQTVSNDSAYSKWLAMINTDKPDNEIGINKPDNEIRHPDRLVTDGIGLYRLFLGLVWSIDPEWPYDKEGKLVVDTPKVRNILKLFQRTDVSKGFGSSLLSESQERVNSRIQAENFVKIPKPIGSKPSFCWFFSSDVQHTIFSPRDLSPTLEVIDDIDFLPLIAELGGGGISLRQGKSLVMSRKLSSPESDTSQDKITRWKREQIHSLAMYLLSEEAQKTLFMERLQIPARKGIVEKVTPKEMEDNFKNQEWQVDGKNVLEPFLKLMGKIAAASADSEEVNSIRILPDNDNDGEWSASEYRILDIFLHSVSDRSSVIEDEFDKLQVRLDFERTRRDRLIVGQSEDVSK